MILYSDSNPRRNDTCPILQGVISQKKLSLFVHNNSFAPEPLIIPKILTRVIVRFFQYRYNLREKIRRCFCLDDFHILCLTFEIFLLCLLLTVHRFLFFCTSAQIRYDTHIDSLNAPYVLLHFSLLKTSCILRDTTAKPPLLYSRFLFAKAFLFTPGRTGGLVMLK